MVPGGPCHKNADRGVISWNAGRRQQDPENPATAGARLREVHAFAAVFGVAFENLIEDENDRPSGYSRTGGPFFSARQYTTGSI